MRTPDYFSDPFFTIGQVFVSDFFAAAQADIPLAGGGVRPKISENNKALPQDRVYFTYHYFRNSLEADASTFLVGPDRADFSMQQYVFGFEKTFNEGATSLELRLPFCDTVDFFTPNFDLNSGGRAGNAVGIFKNLLFATDSLAVAAGLGVGFPTGSDVHGSVNRTAYTVHNDAVYLLPFIGFVSAPPDSTFYHGFLQFDFAANGNRIDFQDYVSPLAVGSFGRLTDQTLVHLDLAAGRWLYRDACARNFTGCAAVAEVHYSAALGSSDSVGGTPTITTFDFSNAANPRDFLSVTLGLHADFRHRTLLRVGGVLPLMSGESRPFDFEIQAALVRRL